MLLKESYIIQYKIFENEVEWREFNEVFTSLELAATEAKAIEGRWRARNPHSPSKPSQYRIVQSTERVAWTFCS